MIWQRYLGRGAISSVAILDVGLHLTTPLSLVLSLGVSDLQAALVPLVSSLQVKLSVETQICEQSVMDQFPNMMNVTFIMHLNVCIAGITVCHLTIGKKSNYDPQSFQNCYSDWKIWEIFGNCQNFKLTFALFWLIIILRRWNDDEFLLTVKVALPL